MTATVGQKFTVTGMTCSHCTLAVSAELSKLEGVTRVDVDLVTGTVLLESVEAMAPEIVGAAIDEAGYELVR